MICRDAVKESLDRDLAVIYHEHKNIAHGAVVMRNGGYVGVCTGFCISGCADYIMPFDKFATTGNKTQGEWTLATIGGVAINEQGKLAIGKQMASLKREAAAYMTCMRHVGRGCRT